MSERVNIYPRRIKLIIFWLGLVFIANILILIFVENLDLIESIYFLVITISTVGYGDISPQTNITRVFVIILIISFLGSVATISETVISRIISRNEELEFKLIKPIQKTGHIVVIGHHEIAQKLAELVSHRLIPVIYLSPNKSDIIQMQRIGIESYILDNNPLPSLNMKMARALYLLLEDDDETIKFSIQMKHINSSLKIYALTQKHMKENYFSYLNMSRSYTLERILGSFISVTTRDADITALPNQLDTKSKHIIFLINDRIDPSKYFTKFRRINFAENNIRRTLRVGNSLISVPRSDAMNAMNNLPGPGLQHIENFHSLYNRIFIGGYNEFVKEVLNHLRVPLDQFYVFTFDLKQKEMAEEDGLKTFYVDQDEFPEIIENNATEKDLIINFFPRLSDSLFVNAVLIDSKKDLHLIQVIYENFEIEIFNQMGVERIIDPIISTTRSMFLILLSELKMTFSLTTRENHYFEMLIDKYNPYLGRSTLDLVNDGFDIIFIAKNSGLEFEVADSIHMIIEENDSLFVRKKLEM